MPPTWNIGGGVSDTVSASNDHTGTCRHAAARLRCVVSTPLGTPVVPDVYIWSTGSSASPLAPGSTGSVSASHVSYSSPTATTRTSCVTPAATSAATSMNSGPATSTGAPASVMIAVSSGAASRQFNGTATAPILAAAASNSTTSGALRSRCATRDPGPAPAASSAWESRLERSSSCAYVTVRARCRTAGCEGRAAAIEHTTSATRSVSRSIIQEPPRDRQVDGADVARDAGERRRDRADRLHTHRLGKVQLGIRRHPDSRLASVEDLLGTSPRGERRPADDADQTVDFHVRVLR